MADATINVFPISPTLTGVGGATATYIPFGSSSGTLTQSSSLTFDDTNKVLTATGSINGGVTVTATNTNTGNGSAILQAQVGGASSNDPKIWLNIPSATLWNLGVDNSDSDKFKMSADAGGDVGTSTLLTLTTAGNLSAAGAIDGVGSVVAAQNTNSYVQIISNNTNTGGGHSALEARVGGAGSGDPLLWFNINGTRLWTIGADNSDSDSLKISSSGGDPGSSTVATITTDGHLGVGGAPLSRLHVESDASSTTLTMRKTTGASSDLIVDYYQAGVNVAQIDVNCSSTTGSFIFWTKGSGSLSEGFRIDSEQNVSIGSAALATNATNGFFYIPTCAGTPTGTPTAKTGRVPIIYDTTNNKFYVYNGAWKGGTAPGAWS